MEDKKLYVSAAKAIRIESKLADFDGNQDDWRDSFYEMWRWQMTYDYAYLLKVDERKSGVYFCAVVKPAFKRDVIDAMDSYHYRNITTEDCLVANLDAYGFEEAFGGFPEAVEADY